jgi:hypothetical protein
MLSGFKSEYLSGLHRNPHATKLRMDGQLPDAGPGFYRAPTGCANIEVSDT